MMVGGTSFLSAHCNAFCLAKAGVFNCRRFLLLLPGALVLSLASVEANGADPEITATYKDVLTSYTWGYKTGAKQQHGSYKNGRSLHAIARRTSSDGLDGSPDQLAWIDEHTGQVAALEQAVGYTEVGVNPATSAVFSSDAPTDDAGRVWWILGGRADSQPFDLVRSI